MARLQFRHLDTIFESRELAKEYIDRLVNVNGLVSDQAIAESFGGSIIAEPIMVKYKDSEENIQVILAIGVQDGGNIPYHIIDSAYLEKGISELSGITEDIRELIDTILQEIKDLNDRVDVVEDDIEDIKEQIEDLSGSTINEININMDDQWEGSGSGTTAVIENGVAKITLTTDNVRVADGYEGQLIHHDHSLTEFIAAVEGIKFEKIETGLDANVKEAYKLVDGDGHQMGDEIIKIYKDSALYNVYLGHVDDTIVSEDDPTVVPGTGETALCFIYQTAKGEYKLVAVNVEKFLDESEFEDGLEVNNHIVKVKIDENSEPFLTVSANGVKLDGVQDAIDAASDDLTDTINEFSAATVSELTEIKETITNNYDELNDKIVAEEERATEAEGTLQDAIDAEADARADADDAIWAALSAETQAREDADTNLNNAIVAETDRATDKENEIESALNDEIDRAEDAEQVLQDNINAVNDRLTAITGQEGDTYKKHNTTPDDSANYINVAESMDNADFILDQKLGELSASTISEVARLDNRIDSINSTLSSQIQEVSGALVDEIDRAEGRENEIESALNNEVERAQSAETALQDAIDAEADARADADNVLSDRINTLEGKNISGDKAIDVQTSGSNTTVSLIINDEDKVLSQNAAGLKATVTVDILKENDKDYILLKGINGQEISRVDATTFIKDGMLDSVEWIGSSSILQFTFNTDAGKEVINIDFAQFVNDEINRQIAALSGAVATINGDVTTPNSTYYKIDDVLVKYNVAGSAVDAAHSLIRYYVDAEGHKYYVSSNAKDMYYSGECLETVITHILSDMETVKEKTEEMEESIVEVREIVYDLRDDVNDLTDALNAEIARATSAETGLHNEITDEATARENEDNALWQALSAETQAREDADTELQNNIDGEATAREEEDERIWAALSAETQAREQEDIEIWSAMSRYDSEIEDFSDRLQQEIDRATSAETVLQEAIYTEEERAMSAETILDEKIDAEADRAQAEEQAIWEALSAETQAREDADTEILSAITIIEENLSENYYTKNEVDTIADGLFASAEYISSGKVIEFYNNDGEPIDSIDATDFIKDGMVDNVIISGSDLVVIFNTDSGKEEIVLPLTDIFNPDNYYTKDEIDTFVENIESAITIEQEAREAEDERIWAALSAETTAREEADTEILSAITIETEARENEDNALWAALSAETQAREQEDIEIWSAITGGGSSISDLEERLQQEIDRATSAETIIMSAVSVEREEREAEDEEIWSAITGLDERVSELENTPDISYVQINNEKFYTVTGGQENYIDLGEGYVKDIVIRTPDEYSAVTESGTIVDTKVIKDIIEENELVTAEALNNLNDRVNTLSGITNNLETRVSENTSAITVERSEREQEDREIWSAITELETVVVEEISSAITTLQQDIENNYYTKNEVDGIVDDLFAGAEYISSGKVIEFYNNEHQVIDSIDATAFIKDGMVDNVFISGSNLVIVFNTDAGKEDIEIPLTDIFNPNNYYTKQEVDTFVENLESAITIEQEARENEDNALWSALSAETQAREAEDIEIWSAITENNTMLNEVIEDWQQTLNDAEFVISSAFNDLNDRMIELSGIVATKQDELVSGVNIKTINNESLLGPGNITIQGGSGSFVRLTSAEYDAAYNAGTLDPDTLYVIVD